MNRIIIDVTQLVHWPGRLTGVPREMYEIATRFHKQNDPNVLFASWVKEVQAMCEVDLPASLAQRGKGVVYKTVTGDTTPTADAPPTLTHTLKRAAKKGLRVGAKFSPELAQKLEARAQAYNAQNYQQITFKKGDKFAILWGEWWDANFIALIKEAQKHGVKIVQFIQDMTPIVVPHLSGHSTESFTDYCLQILPITTYGLAISQSAKNDATQWLKEQKLRVPPIDVFRLGDDFQFTAPEKPKDPQFLRAKLKGDDYLMFVSTIEARKNHMLIYYVYRLAKERGITLPKFLVIGRRGWKTDEMYEMWTKDPVVKDDILFLHDISDAELSWLYDHCLFTVSPSFYEGWGITIAESIGRGVPCLSSATSSTTEIAPGFVEHFSPYSTDECLAGIQRLLEPGVLKKSRAKTKEYKQVSWDDTYAQVKRYIEELQ